MGSASPALRPLAHRIAGEHRVSGSRWDPDFIRRFRAVTDRVLDGWFPAEVRDIENIPATGPVLVVANHSCVVWMPDAWWVGRAIADRRGPDSPTYVLAYDLLFAVPGVGRTLRRIGGLPAGVEAAMTALADGAAVIVFPGGDHDACRPWTDRNRVDFGDHRGFVRLALRAGVPVAPVVAHGAHQAMAVLVRGEPLARLLGLPDVRINVLPVVLGPPLGITPLATVPLPSHVTVAALRCLDWSTYGAQAADDPDVVQARYDEIVGLMQTAMDLLAAEHPHPVVEAAVELTRRLAGQLVPTIPTKDTISPG